MAKKMEQQPSQSTGNSGPQVNTEPTSKVDAEQGANQEQGVEVTPEAMQKMLEQLQAMRVEMQNMRNDMQEMRRRINDLEGGHSSRVDRQANQGSTKDEKRSALKKGVGILATIGASVGASFQRVMGFFAKRTEGEPTDGETAEADTTQSTPAAETVEASAQTDAEKAEEASDSDATVRMGAAQPEGAYFAQVDPDAPLADGLDVLSQNDIRHDAGRGANRSGNNGGTNDTERSSEGERPSLGKRIAIGAAAVLLATGISIGGYHLANSHNQAVAQQEAEAATETVQNETQDLQDLISADPNTLDGDQLDAQMDAFNKEKSDVVNAIDNYGNASATSLDQANDLLKSEKVANYQETLQSLIDARNARSEAAEQLGVDIDTYAELETAANEMHLSVERVKELSDYFGVPADKLGSDEAQNYMRDNLQGPNNISERFNCETPEQARETLIFTAYNNKAALAQYINAMDEDSGVADSSVDGLEMPDDVDVLYQTYCNDQAAYEADFARFVEAMESANIAQRDATSRTMYSYYLSDGNRIVCSIGPENSYGETSIIYEINFVNENGDVYASMLVKNGCAQIEAGKYIPVSPVIVKKAPEKTTTTTTTTTKTPPTTTTTTETETPPPTTVPKDQHANDEQQGDAEGFEDSAQATDQDQTYEKPINGAPAVSDQEAANVSGDTDGNPSNGSEQVPSGDATGQIPGHQPTEGDQRPQEPEW